MTNADLQKMFTDFGDRVAAIIFDNSQTLFIGYDLDRVKKEDITFETIGSTEFVVVAQKSNYYTEGPKDKRERITYKVYHATDCVQDVVVMDEKYAGYRVDPILFK